MLIHDVGGFSDPWRAPTLFLLWRWEEALVHGACLVRGGLAPFWEYTLAHAGLRLGYPPCRVAVEQYDRGNARALADDPRQFTY